MPVNTSLSPSYGSNLNNFEMGSRDDLKILAILYHPHIKKVDERNFRVLIILFTMCVRRRMIQATPNASLRSDIDR